MSAQGVLNYPNGVRQIYYVGLKVDSVDIEFEDTATMETYTANIPYAQSVTTFEYRFNKITVTDGDLVEEFTLDPEPRFYMLVAGPLNKPFIKLINGDPLWLGSALVLNERDATIRCTTSVDPPGTVDVLHPNIASGSYAVIENPAGLTLADPSILSEWALPYSAGETLIGIEYDDDGTWDLQYSTTWSFTSRQMMLFLFYDYYDEYTRVSSRTRNPIILYPTGHAETDCVQWRWQYFEPALPY